MGEEKLVQEPAEDPFSDVAEIEASEEPFAGLSIFRLSGGIMKPAAKTSNRIDGLLAKMLVQPGTESYLKDIDKNLDFLFTSLQLDMINMAADVSSEEPLERPLREQPPQCEVKLQLGAPYHDDSRDA